MFMGRGVHGNKGVTCKTDFTFDLSIVLFVIIPTGRPIRELYSWGQLSSSDIERKIHPYVLTCSRSPENREFSHFTLFCRERQTNDILPNCMTHAQNYRTADLKLIVF